MFPLAEEVSVLSLQLFLGFGTDLTKGWLLGAVGSLEEIGHFLLRSILYHPIKCV